MSEHFILLQNLVEEPLSWIDTGTMITLLVKFLLDLFMVFLIVRMIYKPNSTSNDYAFTYFIFNILIFFLCHLMVNVDLSLGFAFGLFALFSIMRYRTTTISIKDMTFLFSVVCIAVINSIYSNQMSLAELFFINIAIVLSMFTLDRTMLKKQLSAQRILYEKIHLVKAGNRELLIQDLRERTGLDIMKIEIESTNFLNDSAFIWVYYKNTSDTIHLNTANDVKKEQTNYKKVESS